MYTEASASAQPGAGIAHASQRFEYDFQTVPEGPYLDSQPLNDLYPRERRANSFPMEYPYHSAGTFLGKSTLGEVRVKTLTLCYRATGFSYGPPGKRGATLVHYLFRWYTSK